MSNSTTIRMGKPTPYVANPATEEIALPAEMANHPFIYAHAPHAWEYDSERGFLPSLSEITSKPGINGVGDDGKIARVIGWFHDEKGGILIEPTDDRLGPWKHYVASFPCQGGRKHYCFRDCGFVVLPRGRVIVEDHSAEMRDFRQHIRDSGIVAPMDPVVFDLLMEREGRGLRRLEIEVAGNRRLPEAVVAKRARMDAMRAAWAKMTAAPPPEAAPAPPDAPQGHGRRIKPAPADADLNAAREG